MEMGEPVTAEEILEHEHENCPFCQENDSKFKQLTSNIEADWDEDQRDSAEFLTKQIGNDAGDLESNMKAKGEPRPTDWKLSFSVFNCFGKKIDLGDDHLITPNPHHLIPGNESLKKCPELLKWIFESEGHIKEDIGYDVNCAENGMWLPSNNSMRGNPHWACDTVRITYANAAQKRHGSFHDRHIDYSEFVQRALNKIADRMDLQNERGCPYKTSKGDDKYDPPYALIPRLNGLSRRLKGYLKIYNPKGFRPPMYTSRLVLERVKILIDFENGKPVTVNCKEHK